MDYNSLNSEILKLDSKVRYAGAYRPGNVEIYEKIQKGITRLSAKEKTLDTLPTVYNYKICKN
jgi:hypothetical protein